MPFRAKAKENGTVMSEEARERRTKLAVSSSASAVNFVLGVMKVLAGVWTNSLSILTDGVNNFGDVLSNAGAAVGFAVEKKAPTKRFPGGFGRAGSCGKSCWGGDALCGGDRKVLLPAAGSG